MGKGGLWEAKTSRNPGAQKRKHLTTEEGTKGEAGGGSQVLRVGMKNWDAWKKSDLTADRGARGEC